MSKRNFQEKVSFVNFLASTLVNQLKQNQKIINGLEEDHLAVDPDRKVDNTIYRSAQIQSLVRELYYDVNDPFNLKVLASLQKLVPEQLRLIVKGETFAEKHTLPDREQETSTFIAEEASTFLAEEELGVPYINDGINDDDIPF